MRPTASRVTATAATSRAGALATASRSRQSSTRSRCRGGRSRNQMRRGVPAAPYAMATPRVFMLSTALRDRLEVDVGLDALVVLDRLRGYRDPEVPLGLHDRDPEVALEEDLSARGPDIPHRHRRVALREDVEDGLAGG